MDMKIIATTLLFMYSSSRRSVLLPAVDELTEEHNYLHLKEQSSFKTTTEIIILSLSLSPRSFITKEDVPKSLETLELSLYASAGKVHMSAGSGKKSGPRLPPRKLHFLILPSNTITLHRLQSAKCPRISGTTSHARLTRTLALP
jgi:hypothetical protein